jgi:hypothetical protein
VARGAVDVGEGGGPLSAGLQPDLHGLQLAQFRQQHLHLLRLHELDKGGVIGGRDHGLQERGVV